MKYLSLTERLFRCCLLACTVWACDSVAFEWKEKGGYREGALIIPEGGKPGFLRMNGKAVGFGFTNQLSEVMALNNQILENGAGIALGDVDGDGWCDIYFCGAENSNKLFRNLGEWKFEDRTDKAGVGCPGQFSTGVVLADLDGSSQV